MSKLVKFSVDAVILTALVAGSGAAFAEATANVGVASNYVWRGETQSLDQPYVFGGVDYSQGDTGYYAGLTDLSLTEGEYEVDFYGGYKFGLGNVAVDLGAIAYQYPTEDNDTDFSEVYLGASERGFTVRVSYSDDYVNSNESAYYTELESEVELKKDLILGFHYGMKDGDYFDVYTNGGYADWSVSLNKDEFALVVSNTNNSKYGQTDNPRVVVAWTHELEL